MLTEADYAVLYDRLTTVELQEAGGLRALCNTTYLEEAAAMPGHQRVIQDVEFGTAGTVREFVGRPNFAGMWGPAQSVEAAQIKINVDRQLVAGPIGVLDYDEQNGLFDLDGRGRAKMSNNLDVRISHGIADYLAGLATFSTYDPVADDLPKDDGSGANGNAGKVFTAGRVGPAVAANIGINGDRATATFGQPLGNEAVAMVGKAIDELLRYSALRFEHIYAMNQNQIGPAVGSFWSMSDPAVVDCYARYLLEELDSELVKDTGVFSAETPRIFSTMAYKGRRYGIDIMSLPTPKLQPAQDSAATKKAGFPIYIGTNMAVTCAVEPVATSVTPASITAGIAGLQPGVTTVGQHCYWGRGLVNSQLLMKATVASAAA